MKNFVVIKIKIKRKEKLDMYNFCVFQKKKVNFAYCQFLKLYLVSVGKSCLLLDICFMYFENTNTNLKFIEKM